ncbi:MAG TPA: 50S ribosomal protein L11 methyltransferase [Fimbriimonas sp.]|nr:50S ribosomal protein L11 methyltransferase [Fimbriimonas sp.]
MSWIKVEAFFPEPPLDWSPYIEIFREHGIENTIEEDSSLSGCLVEVKGSAEVIGQLKADLLAAGAGEVRTGPLEEVNWEEAWKQFFKPRRVGTCFMVVPSWESYETSPGDILLLLDPGQAFGTGDHPTTRMCLELLEELDLDGIRVADVGCGSGILAIAAAKLGARVRAFDIDPIAVEVAKENAERNGVEFPVICGDGLTESLPTIGHVPQDETPLEPPSRSGGEVRELANRERGLLGPSTQESPDYDLVISNIISATLIRLSHQVSRAVTPGGGWIVSGIIEDNWPEVRKSAEAANFILATEKHEDGWVAARFHKLTVSD